MRKNRETEGKYISNGIRAAWLTAMLVFLCLFLWFAADNRVYGAEIPASEFEDENLYNYIIAGYDTDKDGVLTTEEAEAVTQLIISCSENITYMDQTDYIGSFKGLEYFTNLVYINIYYNTATQPLDISALADMTWLLSLSIDGHKNITDFTPLYSLTELNSLQLTETNLTDISFLENMPHLQLLRITGGTEITDGSCIGKLSELRYLTLNDTGITDISFLSGLGQLEEVFLQRSAVNDLESLRASAATLKRLVVEYPTFYDGAYEGGLDVITECVNLECLHLFRMNITELPDITGFTKLTELYIAANCLPIEESVGNIPDNIKAIDNWMELIGIYDQRHSEGLENIFADNFATVDVSDTIQIEVSGNFAQGTMLSASQITDAATISQYRDSISEIVADIGSIWSFDITTYKLEYTEGQMQSVKSQPYDTATVTITIPLDEFNNSYAVFRQESDGAWSRLDSYITEGTLVFYSDHFSIFSIVASSVLDNSDDDPYRETEADMDETQSDNSVDSKTDEDNENDEADAGDEDKNDVAPEDTDNSVAVDSISADKTITTGLVADIKRHIPDFVAIGIVVSGLVIYEVRKRYNITKMHET